MDETRPISRIEHFLAVITGEDAELPTPQTRVELFLAVIAGGTYLLPEPQSRWELYLARILGQDVELPTPVSRDDRYLAAIAGMEGAEAPAFPISRVEMYLAEWAAQSRARYETVTGAIVSFETVRAAALRRLEVALSPIQSGSGDPSPDNVRSISGHTEVKVYIEPEYDPAADPTASIEIPGSVPGGVVYFGELDVTNGVLTRTWGGNTLGAYSWTYNGTRFAGTIPAKKPGTHNLLCEIFKTSNASTTSQLGNLEIMGNGSTGQIYVKDSRFSDATSFKEAVKDYRVIFELANPGSYQLTPQEVQTLVGQNVVFSDANGDVTVEYRSN